MSTRDLPMRLFRAAVILTAVSCAAAVTPLLAQQAPDAARVAGTSSVGASSASTTRLGPRLSPQFQRYEPGLARSNASASSSLAVAAQGKTHTIVISTLALVLLAVLIVLLI